MEKNKEKLLFSKRLDFLCKEKKLPNHGRQMILKALFDVSQEAVRKWLAGESIPKHERRVQMCEYFHVNYEWLATGKGEIRSSVVKFKSLKERDIQEIVEILNGMTEEKRREAKSIINILRSPKIPEKATDDKEKEEK